MWRFCLNGNCSKKHEDRKREWTFSATTLCRKTGVSNLTNLLEVNDLKIIVIGGVAAGTSAAAKARRNDESAVIKLYDMDYDISY